MGVTQSSGGAGAVAQKPYNMVSSYIFVVQLLQSSVEGSGGLKWMLKQRSGLMPLSRIRLLSTSSGGLLGFSNAILTSQTVGPRSMLCGCMRDSTCLCGI